MQRGFSLVCGVVWCFGDLPCTAVGGEAQQGVTGALQFQHQGSPYLSPSAACLLWLDRLHTMHTFLHFRLRVIFRVCFTGMIYFSGRLTHLLTQKTKRFPHDYGKEGSVTIHVWFLSTSVIQKQLINSLQQSAEGGRYVLHLLPIIWGMCLLRLWSRGPDPLRLPRFSLAQPACFLRSWTRWFIILHVFSV